MEEVAAPKRRGRPRKQESAAVFTAMFCLMMTPEMKEWVLDNGGSEMVRGLISNEQQHWEALHGLLAHRINVQMPLRITWQGDPPRPTQTEEGWLIWGGGSSLEDPAYIWLGPQENPAQRIQVNDIRRVQEPGEAGVILWDK